MNQRHCCVVRAKGGHLYMLKTNFVSGCFAAAMLTVSLAAPLQAMKLPPQEPPVSSSSGGGSSGGTAVPEPATAALFGAAAAAVLVAKRRRRKGADD
ncbi:PEP-CTERM sorting domain-containing protein [Porphyrobacter sp. TH134]|nr:PEP-CTERM sorting domain-containing protein [Porphyrobacter sp. TH134]